MEKRLTAPAPETRTVPAHTATVCCDGKTEGRPESGHPKVYYTFNGSPKVTCLYCDREFVKTGA